MATVMAAMIARARRDIQHCFFSEDAVQPDRAIRFEPQNRIQKRQFEVMLSRGIIREAKQDHYWIDVAKYDVDLRRRFARVRAVLLIIIALLFAGVVLGLIR
jgi:hypothetical protein